MVSPSRVASRYIEASDSRNFTSHLEKALSGLKDAVTYSKTNMGLATNRLADMLVEVQRAFDAADRKDIARLISKVTQEIRSGAKHAGTYPVNQIDHGYDEPLTGGTDIMRKVQNQLLYEQGREPRPDSPWVAKV